MKKWICLICIAFVTTVAAQNIKNNSVDDKSSMRDDPGLSDLTSYQKTVLALPARTNEPSLSLILSVTKVEKRRSSCNDPSYQGNVKPYPQEGFSAHTYILRVYPLARPGGIAPCPLNPITEVVDHVYGDFKIPYDSSKPIVIYTPRPFLLTWRSSIEPNDKSGEMAR